MTSPDPDTREQALAQLAGRHQLRAVDLDGLTPHEIDKARTDGLCRDLMTSTTNHEEN